MRVPPILLFLLLPAGPLFAGAYTSTGVGGGGWLHAGAILPTDPDVILLGSDVSGVYRTEDGGLHWTPWNEGLTSEDGARTHYVEDLVGVDEGGWPGFYAATQGGIYRAPEGGAWEPMTDPWIYSYRSAHDWHALPIPFACLDWKGDSLVVAGAGRVRWGQDLETSYYPGLDPDLYEPRGAFDEQYSVWIYDTHDAASGWQPARATCSPIAR